MTQIKYINTQEIRHNLMGFLGDLAAGGEYVVLNRSKPVVAVSGSKVTATKADAQTNIKEFLAIGDKARASAKSAGVLDPTKTHKRLYTETMGKKYGLS